MSSIIAYMLVNKSTGNTAVTDKADQRRRGMAELGSQFAKAFENLPAGASDANVDEAVEAVILGLLTDHYIDQASAAKINRFRLVYSSEGFGATDDEYAIRADLTKPKKEMFVFDVGSDEFVLELVTHLDKHEPKVGATKDKIKMHITLSRNTGTDLLGADNYLSEVVTDILNCRITSLGLAKRYTLGSITFRRCK